MKRFSDIAIEIINNLHTERLDYKTEYLPLIDAANSLSDYEDTNHTPEECAAAFEELERKWISVEDRLPDEFCKNSELYNITYLLVCLTNGAVCEGWWDGFDFKSNGSYQKMPEMFKNFNPVTHWMPIPAPSAEAALKEQETNAGK